MATGDLTKDGLAERVVVYDTPVATDFGTARQLYIYQQKEGHWQLWQKINGGILPSENGGMMGDPFEGITIERGTIVITHFGGSRQKWTYTHRTQPLPQLAGFEPGSNEVKLPAPEEAFYY